MLRLLEKVVERAESKGRRSSLVSLQMPVQYVKGVGPNLAGLLARLGVQTAEDLLFYFPRDYQDRSQVKPIADLKPGEVGTVIARVVSAENTTARTGMVLTKVVVEDGSGEATLIFFGQKHLRDRFLYLRGREILIHGPVQGDWWSVQFKSPDWEEVPKGGVPRKVLPIYPLTEGLFQGQLRRAIHNCLQMCLHLVPERLPKEVLVKRRFPGIHEALKAIHEPESLEEKEAARTRLAYEEFFVLQVALAQRRFFSDQKPGIQFAGSSSAVQKFISSLPFELTGSQKRVIQQIVEDMESPRAMNRLLQGDVGSGKTVVAAAAVVGAVHCGYQAAVMAPTEILAEQHYRVFSGLLQPFGVDVALLVSGLPASERARVYEGAANGLIPVVVGTHALIQDELKFSKLGLVIIDEQHRFGVVQRAMLREKGGNPDVLVMTATPIPRTLALTVYGDLDVSIIDEMPPGRRPVRTYWKPSSEREKVYEGVRRLVREGRQAYIVCPLVEESEKLSAQAATELASYLQEHVFPEFRVGLLHGQMRPAEKDAVMDAFRKGEIHILVATTVVEVGVDVPNASVMVVEGAERFGLAQLHQLRGRVGRGAHQSYCVLLGDPKTPEGQARLEVMVSTTDGFRIAEEDLRLRGPGEFYGTRQSGLPDLRVADIVRDVKILEQARSDAQELVLRDPKLLLPEHEALAEAVRQKCSEADLVTVS
jgi:ATP-dependent DNA helicase RecG